MYVTYTNGSGDPTSSSSRWNSEVFPDQTNTIVSVSVVVGGGEGNATTTPTSSSSATTTMPSSPETTTALPLPRIASSSSPTPAAMMMLMASSTSMTTSTTDLSPSEEEQHHHHHFTTCTGLSALIQAATSQLEYLAEIAATEYAIQKNDDDENDPSPSSPPPPPKVISSRSQQPQRRRTSLVTTTPRHPPTPPIITTPTMMTSWKEDSFPEQLMKLLMDVRTTSSSSANHPETTWSGTTLHPDDMISFLPNGKYFVVRQSAFTLYLRDTHHSLYAHPDPNHTSQKKDERNKMRKEDDDTAIEQSNDITDSNGISSFPNDHPHSTAKTKYPYHHITKTRIRTFPEFVHTLLVRYHFTWIDHRYICSSPSIQWWSDDKNNNTTHHERDNDQKSGTATISPSLPLATPAESLPNSSTIYPEIMVFRHEHFLEQNSSLCQQIPDYGASSQSPPPPPPSQHGTNDPSRIHQMLPQHHRKSNYTRHHSKVVHNHHAVVVALPPPSSSSQLPTSTPTPASNNDPATTATTVAGTTSSATTQIDISYTHPTSPIVVDMEGSSSSTISKRRLSPGFIRQQELKNGVTTSKQKVKMDLSNVMSSVTLPVASVTDESTRTSGLGIGEDYHCDTTTTVSTATTTDATTNVVEHTEPSMHVPMASTTTSTNNDVRKLSSGCESDMTNTTTQTESSIVETTANDGRTVFPRPIGRSEETTATMIRNIAISIANEKLQLPTVPTSVTARRNPEEIMNGITQQGIENETTKTSSPVLSELVELGITTCTKEIVIAAIECLLSQPSHSREVYQQNLQELSKSSLPNLVPICQHIFENHPYLYNSTTYETAAHDTNTTTTSNVEMDGLDSRSMNASLSVAITPVMANTVTPENNGVVSNEAQSSSLVRVITTGSDGDHTINQIDIEPRTHTIDPRNLNDDSTTIMVSTESSPHAETVLSTRVTTRRSSAKGNGGTTN